MITCILDVEMVWASLNALFTYGSDYIPFVWRLAWQSRFGDEEPAGLRNINKWTYLRWAFFGLVALPKYAALMTSSGFDLSIPQAWATCLALAFSVEALLITPQKSKEEVYLLLESIKQRKAGKDIDIHAAEKSQGQRFSFAGVEQPLTERAATILQDSLWELDYSPNTMLGPTEPIRCFLHGQEKCKSPRCQSHMLCVFSFRDSWRQLLHMQLCFTWLLFVLIAQDPVFAWAGKVTNGLKDSWVLDVVEPVLYGIVVSGHAFLLNVIAIIDWRTWERRPYFEALRRNCPKLASFLFLVCNLFVFYCVITFWHPFGVRPRLLAFQESLSSWPMLLPTFGIFVLALGLPLKLLLKIPYIHRTLVPSLSSRERTAEETAKLEKGMTRVTLLVLLDAVMTITILLLYFLVVYDETQTERPHWTAIYGLSGKHYP